MSNIFYRIVQINNKINELHTIIIYHVQVYSYVSLNPFIIWYYPFPNTSPDLFTCHTVTGRLSDPVGHVEEVHHAADRWNVDDQALAIFSHQSKKYLQKYFRFGSICFRISLDNGFPVKVAIPSISCFFVMTMVGSKTVVLSYK